MQQQHLEVRERAIYSSHLYYEFQFTNMHNEIRRNEFFRLKAKELINALDQAHAFIKEHNLSRGLIAESVLRDFLRSTLPEIAKVSQGFVERNGILSHQCDIIIYDRIHYAPLYSYGEIEIIPSDAVYAIIEVKTNIDAKQFGKVLHDFELLYRLRVSQKFLFIYNGCQISTLKHYFYGPYVPKYDREEGEPLYDQGNYEAPPDAIVSLSPDYYLGKGHYQDDNRDMKGYMAYTTTDNTDNNIACIQKFVEQLRELISLPQKEKCDAFPFLQAEEGEKDDDLKIVAVKNGFGLVEF